MTDYEFSMVEMEESEERNAVSYCGSCGAAFPSEREKFCGECGLERPKRAQSDNPTPRNRKQLPTERVDKVQDLAKVILLALLDELNESYAQDSFQATLLALCGRGDLKPRVLFGRRQLCEMVQAPILPKYGFPAPPDGVYMLEGALEPYWADKDIRCKLSKSDDLLRLPNGDSLLSLKEKKWSVRYEAGKLAGQHWQIAPPAIEKLLNDQDTAIHMGEEGKAKTCPGLIDREFGRCASDATTATGSTREFERCASGASTAAGSAMDQTWSKIISNDDSDEDCSQW